MSKDVVEQVKRLVALAADARGNQHERENAAVKACEIIAREKLEIGSNRPRPESDGYVYHHEKGSPPRQRSYGVPPSYVDPFVDFADLMAEILKKSHEEARRQKAQAAQRAADQIRRQQEAEREATRREQEMPPKRNLWDKPDPNAAYREGWERVYGPSKGY